MKITIEGPQGCGKTLLARIIKGIIEFSKPNTTVILDDEGFEKFYRVKSNEVLIRVKDR